MNSVTDTDSVLTELFVNDWIPRTTDLWETVHIQSNTAEDEGMKIIKRTGMNAVVLGEQLCEMKQEPWQNQFGYYDEGMSSFTMCLMDRGSPVFVEIFRPYHLSFPPKPNVSFMEDYYYSYSVIYFSRVGRSESSRWSWKRKWLGIMEYDRTSSDWSVAQRSKTNRRCWQRRHPGIPRTRSRKWNIIFDVSSIVKNHWYCSYGDHGIPFLEEKRQPFENPHNEPYRVPFMIYNSRIKNPEKKVIPGNFYQLSIPST